MILTKQEEKWISERRITRLTDNKEVQIYPMGAERYLSSILLVNTHERYNIKADIEGKNVLVIPGHGNSSFLFAHAGAKSVTVYDKDPVTIAWMKAFKKYYHYRGEDKKNLHPSIGELFSALTSWYPPLLNLAHNKYINLFFWLAHPNTLRRLYIHRLVDLVSHAAQSKVMGEFELEKNIQFYTGTADDIPINQPGFDTAFVPYLLGVRNGIEKEEDIVHFMKQLILLIPKGSILISPANDTKEFYFLGTQYFVTTPYSNIQDIPELKPLFFKVDKTWFRTGLAVFRSPNLKRF